MAEKETSTKWNAFSHVFIELHSPICSPAAHNDSKLGMEHC